MKIKSYLTLIAAVALGLTACDENQDVFEMGTLDGIEMVARSASVEDGSTIMPVDSITVDFNNLVGIDASKAATLNGQAVQAHVSPVNGMQLVIPVALEFHKDYTLVIPDGMVYRRDDQKVTFKGLSVSFNTNYGLDVTNVARSLTNANATAEAVALYQELLENYGKVMYSGAMGGVAFETAYTDFISANNGGAGYPKIVGFDYIHLYASQPGGWVDYSDITPVKSVWEAGSIPTVTWHWNVPENPENPDYTQISYRAANFSVVKALTPGTNENNIINADIEKLAGYMSLLQDAHIPVLFRPLHEAAGDYTWGPWFWWGNDGVEATRQLWSYLRDKLEGEYGLNNLIWVWTMQTSDQGQPASVETIRNAYPGDNLVDMVGTDLYPDDALTDQTAQFNLINTVVAGKKIICLSEVGNLIDPEAAAANNALWSYFMNWYDNENYNQEGAPLVYGFGAWNTQAVTFGGTSYPNPWAAVANNRYVRNR